MKKAHNFSFIVKKLIYFTKLVYEIKCFIHLCGDQKQNIHINLPKDVFCIKKIYLNKIPNF